jgi:uncharacterized protein
MANPQKILPADADTIAWYRQFWPWFLIILPGIVVIASLITVFIAFKKADSLVVDNYYKEGRSINNTFAEIHTAKTLGIKGTISITDDNVGVAFLSNTAITDDEILLSFSHPFNKEQDLSIHLKNAGNGLYRATFPENLSGKWYISLKSLTATKPWQINKTIELPAENIEFSAQ